MNNQEETTLSRNTKITVGAAILIVSTISGAFFGAYRVFSDMQNKIEQRLLQIDNRLERLEEQDEIVYSNRWTAQHTEIWWLRSERANPGGTGFIDPREITREQD